MRRKDREITVREDILEVLDRCQVLRLGLCHENRPYVVPLHFGWEVRDGVLELYMHGAAEGKKTDMMRANPYACFEADCDVQNLEHDIACKWSARFASVIGEGEVEILSEETEKIHGLDLLMQHQGFAGKPEYSSAMLAAVAVFRLRIHTLTGKQKV